MGRIVSKKELAEIVGVSERTLTDWQEKGMPIKVHTSRGLANEYDTADVFKWREQFVANGERMETSKERLDRLNGDLKELELAEKSGMYVMADDAEWALESVIISARSELMRFARKLKKHLKKEYELDVELEKLQDLTGSVLSRLAEHSPDDEEEAETGAEEMATT